MNVFADFDFQQFWEPSEYALKEYVGDPLVEESAAAVETELGYKLPASYVDLQNGRTLIHLWVKLRSN